MGADVGQKGACELRRSRGTDRGRNVGQSAVAVNNILLSSCILGNFL